ncbi:MAG TPA: hypothetical protein VIM16_05870 [Mucilaginibacter sp.]|jgi:hypothetical protein
MTNRMRNTIEHLRGLKPIEVLAYLGIVGMLLLAVFGNGLSQDFQPY